MDNQVEEHRNQLLRRADWRFLLDNPWPEKSICLSGGFLAQAVRAVSAQYIPADKITSGECDLAVATNPGATTLRKAWQTLRAGGSFYGEWYFPLAGGTAGIRRSLAAAGFTNVACYWPWPIPDFSPALFWLPLDAPQAVRYFLSNRSQPVNWLARIGSRGLEILWNFGRNTGRLAPVCVTARKTGAPERTAFPAEPEDEILAGWGDGKPQGSSRRCDTIMWTGGKRSINKVILYRFATDEEKPRLVVKLPRTPESVPALTHEAHILQALHARKSEAAVHAPAVLFWHELHGKVALGETVVFGQPLYTVLNPGNSFDLAIKVTEWLASLTVGEPLQPRTDWWDRLIEPALYDFEQAFGPVLDGSVLPNCRAILNRLGELPPAFEHRDCSPWNLLVTAGGELAVLDWESAEEHGLPALDLAYFLAYLAFFLDGAMKTGNFIASYRRAADPTTITGRLQAACQQRYLERTGLDPAAMHPLRLLAWLIHTRSEVRHLSADAGGAPPPVALRRSLFYNLILIELAQEPAPARPGFTEEMKYAG